MASQLTLISHTLCPYVQRAAIVLAEKGIRFERQDIDLAHKPDWFLKISPLGKTPVLRVDGEAIFESAVICEYLDETAAPRLHPEGALRRARHRSWMEFGSAILNTIGAFYNAPNEEALAARAAELRAKFRQVEAALGSGPYFSGEQFSMVDAVFGPVFRYFDVFDEIGDFGVLADTPRVNAWRRAGTT
ncbi:glutathione S-transferase family protein [Polaromonas sp. P1(28)-8]|nr:glutathione S-transferase family protein [Polaromonas sp. P1(28)-8]